MQRIAPGTIIDERFEIIEFVGSGGMGVVYRARQAGLERDVALKFLHDHLLEDADALGRFAREAVVLQAMVHCNINRFFFMGGGRSALTSPWSFCRGKRWLI